MSPGNQRACQQSRSSATRRPSRVKPLAESTCPGLPGRLRPGHTLIAQPVQQEGPACPRHACDTGLALPYTPRSYAQKRALGFRIDCGLAAWPVAAGSPARPAAPVAPEAHGTLVAEDRGGKAQSREPEPVRNGSLSVPSLRPPSILASARPGQSRTKRTARDRSLAIT